MKRIIAVFIALMLLAGAAFADESSLVVRGTGTVSMEADCVSASLGISMTGEDLAVLQKQVNETVLAICSALKEAGMAEKDISTNYIYISPRYDYSGEVERMIGYSINNTMTIQTEEMDKIGAYIDAAFAAGANTFDSINFSVKDDSDARLKALELAVVDAGRKAAVIAAASGMELGAVDEIKEIPQEGYYYNTAAAGVKYATTESAAYDAGVTVRAAQVNVTANVEISYDLK